MLKHLRKNRGQSALEYSVLVIIVMGALLAAGTYFKRGIQGRWKDAVDNLGDQYDPQAANGSVIHAIEVNSVTSVVAINAAGGFWTTRTDQVNTIETKQGTVTVGAYAN